MRVSTLVFVAVALDPRYKFGEVKGEEVWKRMSKTLDDLFEYGKMYTSSEKKEMECNVIQKSEVQGTSRLRSLIAKRMRKNDYAIGPTKSELEKYLAEETAADTTKYDILMWWKVNSSIFPVLSRLARDVLAVPISTVTPEFAFSASGRILDEFRSSLTPFMVQALICTQDWMRSAPVNDEEDTEQLIKLEEELFQEKSGLNVSETSSSNNNFITVDDSTS